jgi:hypothetical protein
MMRSDRSVCSHEPFGCGLGFHDSDFVRAAGLCKGCALRASRVLRVKIGDLGFALFAYNHAKAGRPAASPTLQQVWAVIDQANQTLPPPLRIQMQDKYIHVPEPMRHAPADSCLPEGDRVAA